MFVLALATVAAYYHAFFDVPRADQLIYLYRTNGLDLWGLTIGSYDFNRYYGDGVLFRPVLYLLLGLERWAWGYRFVLWQATSIGLHVAVVLSLFAYFRHRLIRPPLARASATPFVLALFFALSYAGTEMVAWHHIVGYLLFCLLAVQAALAYQRLVTTPALRHGITLVAGAGVACFTYELGNVLALILAGMLFCLILLRRRDGQEATTAVGVLMGSAVMLVAASCGYALWSWLDYRQAAPPPLGGPPLEITRFLAGLTVSAGYWFCTTFWPAALNLVPGARIDAARPFPLPSVLAAVNFTLCLAMAWAAREFVFARRGRDLARDWLPAAAFLLLAAGYTAVIVLGRSLERGILETLSNNTYYAYIFTLFLLFLLFHLVLVPAEAAEDARGIRRRRLLLACLAAIALISGACTFALQAAMHRSYSGPIAVVLHRIETLRAQHGTEPDFSFRLAADCPAFVDIPWFAQYAQEKQSRYTIATALFPHTARSGDGKYRVACR